MNRFQPNFLGGREATLRYLDSDYQVVVQGEFVRCAVTSKPIPLDQLRYWNVERQEAYSSAEISMQRYLEISSA
ncbi:MAG: DUF2093 domain-containing protein [Pseudomonadota bacterium]